MKNKLLLPVLLSVAAVLGLTVGMFLNFPSQQWGLQGDARSQRELKVRQIIDYIDFEYVDEVNTDSLLDMTITDLLRRLDPHSTYIPLEEVAANEESLKGSFEGIGIEFKIFRDTLTIVNVIEGGPSSSAGLKAGERILYADGEALFGKEVNTRTVVSKLKGKAGSEVKLDIYTPLTGKNSTKTVKRGEVPLRSVQAAFSIDDTTAYLKLVRFSETTAREVKQVLKTFQQEGKKRVILDLRDNPGGLLGAARDVADQFLSEGKMIVFTRDREGQQSEIRATGKGYFEKGEVAVLINEGSASASEIVAGAIQDNDRGRIIGRRSFGKGLVQEEIQLSDGSRMRLTTQRYYTPTGRSIQKPYEDYDSRFLENSGYTQDLPSQDSANLLQNEFRTPAGRKVYGGGGITPDRVVPFDTTRRAALLYHLAVSANMDEKAFRYVDEHREVFQAMKPSAFVKNFEVDDEVLAYFFSEPEELRTSLDPRTLTILKTRIKALIASNWIGYSGYIEVYYPEDPMINEALRGFGKE